MRHVRFAVLVVMLAAAAASCVKKSASPPVAPAPAPVESTGTGASTRAVPPVTQAVPPAPPTVPMDPPVSAMSDPLAAAAIEDINKSSPLQAVFFAYDSDALDDAARSAMTANAQVMKKYPSWIVTIEGHCDERGTAEYNLALGDRRALAVKNYMVSMGIGADRLKTVSYGSEFPFAPGHDEQAWGQNRRAHFMLTAK